MFVLGYGRGGFDNDWMFGIGLFWFLKKSSNDIGDWLRFTFCCEFSLWRLNKLPLRPEFGARGYGLKLNEESLGVYFVKPYRLSVYL